MGSLGCEHRVLVTSAVSCHVCDVVALQHSGILYVSGTDVLTASAARHVVWGRNRGKLLLNLCSLDLLPASR